MYFMVDPAGMVVSVNPFGAEQLGYTVDELVGRPVLNVFFEADREAAREHVASCLEHVGQSMSWELRKVRKDGSMLWVRETARAVQRPCETPIVLVACEDVTSRIQAQDRLRESETRLREHASLLELTHDTIAVRDVHDIIAYWNRGGGETEPGSSSPAAGRCSATSTAGRSRR